MSGYQPGNIGNAVPAGEDYLLRRIAALEQSVRELAAASTLNAATIDQGGLTVTGGGSIGINGGGGLSIDSGGGVTVNNGGGIAVNNGGGVTVNSGGNIVVGGGIVESANFDGNVSTPSAGSVGWGLGSAAGNAVFNNIVLRGQIIGNDALVAPVTADVANGGVGGLTFTSTLTTWHTENVAVPTGFSKALVMLVATAGMSTGASVSILFCRAVINGVTAPASIAMTVGGGGSSGTLAQSYAALVTGLSGGTFPVACQASSSAAPSAGNCNATVSASVVFLR